MNILSTYLVIRGMQIKIAMWYYNILIKMINNNNKKPIIPCRETWTLLNPYITSGNAKWCSHLGKLAVRCKVNV